MRQRDESVSLPSDTATIRALGELLQEHQAHINIVYLYDHGWQVGLSSPGGVTYVQACEGADKWPKDGGPPLADTILKAMGQATAEGWW
jgi:hypothetical protein